MKPLKQAAFVAILCVFGVIRFDAQQSPNQPQQIQGQPQQGQTALPVPSSSPQQNLQPQPGQPAQTQPCPPTTPKPPSDQGKQFHFHLPKSVQQVFDNERKKIEKVTGIQVPSVTPDDILKQPQKPCTPAPAAPPANPKQ